MKIGIPDVFSAIQNHCLAKKSADIALYEPKKQVYFQLKKHLEQPFSGRTAYERFLDIIPMQHTLSRDEVENRPEELETILNVVDIEKDLVKLRPSHVQIDEVV